MKASELLASTGQFVYEQTGPTSATGTPADSVTVLVRIFTRQETTQVPPYAFDIVGIDPELPSA